MKRLVIAALVVVALGVVVSSATASSGTGVTVKPDSGVIYDSTPAPLPGNVPSVGPESSAFHSLGNKVQFAAGGARRLKSVVVMLSSWACMQGHWYLGNCSTPNGATFQQPVTLTIWDATRTTKLVSSTQTFQVPYRPSASPQCAHTNRPGGWYQPATGNCFNGLATQARFDFSGNVTLPDTVVYEISYNTSHYGPNPIGEGTSCFGAGNCPYDSLNIGLSTGPTVGTDPDQTTVWTNGAAGPLYDPTYTTPAVQFNAARLWKV
jgi:hypothetical protein